jgi:hypothetical protein
VCEKVKCKKIQICSLTKMPERDARPALQTSRKRGHGLSFLAGWWRHLLTIQTTSPLPLLPPNAKATFFNAEIV